MKQRVTWDLLYQNSEKGIYYPCIYIITPSSAKFTSYLSTKYICKHCIGAISGPHIIFTCLQNIEHYYDKDYCDNNIKLFSYSSLHEAKEDIYNKKQVVTTQINSKYCSCSGKSKICDTGFSKYVICSKCGKEKQ